MNSTTENISKVLEEMMSLVSNNTKFEAEVISLFKIIDENYQNRLMKWFRFFNENHNNNPCIYSPTIYALINACKYNELFREQTQYEFEQSICFYEKIVNSSSLVYLTTYELNNKLLSIALIYGKYASMQVRKFGIALDKLCSNFSSDALDDFFECLFIKYQNPKVLTTHIDFLTAKEIDVLMYLLRGNSLKKYPDLEVELTTKEVHTLLYLSPDLMFKNEVLKRATAISKIINATNNSIFINEFINTSVTFKYRIDNYLEDINFWIKAYSLISECNFFDLQIGVREYVDFIEYKRNEVGDIYNLKGVTPLSLTKAVINWHEKSEYGNLHTLFSKSWNGRGQDDYYIEGNNEKYLFTEIKNGKQLFKESHEMKHCAFSYINKCIEGNCSIWSLKKEINNEYKNYLTIEVVENEIIQIRGKRNAEPSDCDNAIIEKWAKDEGYFIPS